MSSVLSLDTVRALGLAAPIQDERIARRPVSPPVDPVYLTLLAPAARAARQRWLDWLDDDIPWRPEMVPLSVETVETVPAPLLAPEEPTNPDCPAPFGQDVETRLARQVAQLRVEVAILRARLGE